MDIINNYNNKVFNDIRDKTINEIEKCEKILQNLKNLFLEIKKKYELL